MFTAVGVARWLGVDESLVRGLVAKSVTAPIAMGVAAHGIGTSRAFSVHPEVGAYASLGMGLHGMVRW